jgi:hypothetical protein
MLSVALTDGNIQTANPGTLNFTMRKAPPTLTASSQKLAGTTYAYILSEVVSPFNQSFDGAVHIYIMSNHTVPVGCANLTPDSSGSVSCEVVYGASSHNQTISGALTTNSPNLTSSPSQTTVSFVPSK